jgi:UDP-N-acetylmuramoyl-tripeptide--D-alanyl-D-alanine ligase
MTVDQVRRAAGAVSVDGPRDLEIAGFSTDSRSIKPGDLFVALVGEKFDGHDFLDTALRAGASGAVFSKDLPSGFAAPGKLLIRVPDTLTALGNIARAYRRMFTATVVGITGSNGKTTTKEMTRHILEGRFPTVASPASFNNFIGLPLTIFKVEASTRVAVLEMGTDHPGEIARLAEIAEPDIGVITNVGRTHLEGLKSVDGVAAAKAELLYGLRPGGTAILNADDPRLARLVPRVPAKVITFGVSEPADLYATSIERVEGGLAFAINGAVRVRLGFPGLHNVYNALAAAAVARRLGLDLGLIAERLASFRLPAMRLEEKTVRGAVIINDAYNANPESMARAIDELSARNARRKFFVFADMLELGEGSSGLHRELGERAGRAGFDFYFAAGSLAKEAVDAVVAAGVPAARARFFESLEALAAELKSSIQPGDAVLVKASRGMGLDRVIPLIE